MAVGSSHTSAHLSPGSNGGRVMGRSERAVSLPTIIDHDQDLVATFLGSLRFVTSPRSSIMVTDVARFSERPLSGTSPHTSNGGNGGAKRTSLEGQSRSAKGHFESSKQRYPLRPIVRARQILKRSPVKSGSRDGGCGCCAPSFRSAGWRPLSHVASVTEIAQIGEQAARSEGEGWAA